MLLRRGFGFRGTARRGTLRARLADRRLLEIAGGAPAAAPRLGRHARDLGLAVRADLPRRIEWLGAVRARVLELAQAVRAAQEVVLDLVVAVRAQQVAGAVQPRLGGLHLQLALADVVQVLRRAHDHVDDRADEREQRRDRRGADEHGVFDAPPRVGERVIDQRDVDDDEEEDQQLDGRVEARAVDPEDRFEGHVLRILRGVGAAGFAQASEFAAGIAAPALCELEEERAGSWASAAMAGCLRHRKSLPKPYPIPKKTKITSATLIATAAIITPTRGPSSSFTACSGRRPQGAADRR